MTKEPLKKLCYLYGASDVLGADTESSHALNHMHFIDNSLK